MVKKLVAMSLVMVLSFAACAIEPSTQEIVDGVIQSMYNVNTYQFDMDMTTDMVVEAEGEVSEESTAIDSSGTIDVTNRQLRMEITTSTTTPKEGETKVGMEMYLIGNTAYFLTDIPEMESTWIKSRMPVGTWEDVYQVEPQIELLKSAEVKLIGSEKIRGVDCYVLQLTTDVRQLWQIAMDQQKMAGQDTVAAIESMWLALNIPEEAIQKMFRSYSAKQWIEKDTYFLAKVEVEMSVEITPEAMGFQGEEEEVLTMDISITSHTYNYNETFSIVVPPEAEEAIEVGREEAEAAGTELKNVQAAVLALIVDNEIPGWQSMSLEGLLPNPVTVATNDMSAFPDATSAVTIDKVNDPDGNAYKAGDKDGFILFQHDITADGTATKLVNYLATQYTKGTYTVDANGTVTQVTTGFE